MDREALLRRRIYDETLATGVPPTIARLADASGQSETEVRGGLQQLAAGRIVVLQPSSGEILMAPPFSAVPTAFLVTTARHTSNANCAWDALGVPIMMRTPGRVRTACGCCGEAMALDVDRDRPPSGSSIVHFAVPAIKWWNDIVFT
jgi:alkylmercury lyase-like protein